MALTTNSSVWKILSLIFVSLTVLFLLCFYFSMVFLTLVVGFILIILTEKMIQDYRRRMNKYHYGKWTKRFLGSLLVIFWSAVVIFLIVGSLEDLSTVVSDLRMEAGAQGIISTYFTELQPYVPAVIFNRIIGTNALQNIENLIFSSFTDILSNLGFFLLNAVLIIPMLFHLYFKRGHRIREAIYSAVPKEYRPTFIKATQDIIKQMHDFFEAKIIESVVVGAVAALGFYVIGLKGWLLFAILVGFLNVIPYLGPIMGAIPPLLVGLIDSPWMGFLVLLIVLAAQAVDNFYLVPFMIPDKVSMNSLLSVILLLIGAQLFGIMGLIFILPMYLVYEIVLVESYNVLVHVHTKKKRKKGSKS